MRPYLDAGVALYRAGRLYVDDDPSDVDIRIVERSMEDGERGRIQKMPTGIGRECHGGKPQHRSSMPYVLAASPWKRQT
jgi:hypothetical protein